MRLHFPSLSRTLLVSALSIALGATLGFAQTTAPSAGQSGQSIVASAGVLVAGVQAGSPAEKAGIVRGDIILEVNGAAVNTPAALQQVISAGKSGDVIAMKIQHGDAAKTVNITLADQNGRLWIGILMSGAGRGMGFGMRYPGTGALVASVVAGSPAEKAGLKQGDLILSVDGTAVDAQHALGDLIAAKKVGDTVTLSVQSWGQSQPRDVKVTLVKSPSSNNAYLGIEYTMGRGLFGRGMQGYGTGAGVVVSAVAGDGPAAKAGVAARDLITKVEGITITDPQQVVDAVAKHKPGDSLQLTVYQAATGKTADLTITLGNSPSDTTKAYLGVSLSSAFRDGRGMQFGMPRFRALPPATATPTPAAPTI